MLRLVISFTLFSFFGTSNTVAQTDTLKFKNFTDCIEYIDKSNTNKRTRMSLEIIEGICGGGVYFENNFGSPQEIKNGQELSVVKPVQPGIEPVPSPFPHVIFKPTNASETFNNPSKLINPSKAIEISVYDYLNARGSEAPGYGLYSYVILRNQSKRSVALLKQIFRKVRNVATVSEQASKTNIIYVPSTRKKASKELVNSYENEANIWKFISSSSKNIASYNFEISKQLIDAICDKPLNEVNSLCLGDKNSGPYLITYASKIGNMRPLPPPFLLVDLTQVDESAFDTLVSCYLDQVQADKFDDRSKIDTFRNKLLTLILRSASSLEPISAALLGIVHQVNAADSKDTDKK